jgi:hypothetical protein
MPKWPRHPTIYEINTWVWLSDISQKYGVSQSLARVPAREWDAIADFSFDAVWLMGVWERSPAGIAIDNQNAGLLEDFRRALPDFGLPDNVGSPYCVRRYEVDPQLGGPGGLEIAQKELAKRGMRLSHDFVPNHVAPDHPWGFQAESGWNNDLALQAFSRFERLFRDAIEAFAAEIFGNALGRQHVNAPDCV